MKVILPVTDILIFLLTLLILFIFYKFELSTILGYKYCGKGFKCVPNTFKNSSI